MIFKNGRCIKHFKYIYNIIGKYKLRHLIFLFIINIYLNVWSQKNFKLISDHFYIIKGVFY